MLKTRLPTMDAVERERAEDKEDATDTAGALLATQGKSPRVDDLRPALVADKGIGRNAPSVAIVGCRRVGSQRLPPLKEGRTLRYTHEQRIGV